MNKRVFIGVGHGGSDPGAIGHVKEAEANLIVALRLREELMRHGVAVGMSRMSDVYDPLRDEINKAHAFGADLAVDVHSNAGGGEGFEAYIQTNAYAAASRGAAEKINTAVIAIGQRSRGIKTKLNAAKTDYFGFLRQVKCPAVIVEGFFVDSADALNFDTVDEQEQLGIAYAKGILAWLGIAWQEKQTVETMSFAAAVDVLHNAGVINTPAYWTRGNEYSVENVRLLITRTAEIMQAQEDAKNDR